MTEETRKSQLSRRQLLGTSAFVAAAGASGLGGALLAGSSETALAAGAAKGGMSPEVKPGNWTNITSSSPAASVVKCVLSACRRCVS
ncbi:nitrous-oxide reductase [Brucella sp. F96/2]|nr:nitrous-oxide reductase [Brucella sp. F23/97]ENT12829.1 nitrous-oxide reductase [Brucella sp. F96/2]ENT19999.1 nitrous-oxide reductase [Brucella sp. UK1/97]